MVENFLLQIRDSMKMMTLLSFLLIFLVACNKEDPTPTPPTSKIFETVWSTRIYEAPLENVGSDNAYLYKNWYILTGDHWATNDPSLFAFDTKTGQLAWKWTQTGRIQDPGYLLEGKDNILIILTSKGIFSFDIEQQKTRWEIVFEDFNSVRGNGIVIRDDFVYFTMSYFNFSGPETYYRANINTGITEKIYMVEINNFWSPSLSPPAFWKNPSTGDTLMVFLNGKSKSGHGPETSPTDLIAVNLTTKKLAWQIDSIMEVPTNLGNPPVIYENSVIFGGDWSIYSVDLVEAKVEWRTQFTNMMKVGNFNRTGLLLEGNRVYANPDVFDVMCLDAKTGSVIWHNKNAAANCSPNMLYKDDMLIIGSFGLGSVIIMDALTGNVIHKEQGSRTFYTDVLYDEATDMYFVQDFAQAVGFKINKPK